jgi:preprotein translocase subunit SecB
MKPSPITFVSFKFLRVHVDVDFEAQAVVGDDFDFSGAMLAWSLNHGRHDEGSWWVAVGFATQNADDNPRCPYNIDMQAVGTFRVSDNVDEVKREELVFENGAALVYGAIRDMVSTITARSISGPMMLPTPSFMGEFKAHQQKLVKQGRR